jgi:predicted PhzF superfamily epimerase YddE/YHI9
VLEVPLCGHGTLASAAVVMERLETSRRQVTFHTASGPLTVTRTGERYVMDFPVRRSARVAIPEGFAEMLGAQPIELYANEFNYLALLESAQSVRSLEPDLAAVAHLDLGGLIVTAAGDNGYDIVSRYFSPAKGIAEDPVTGGAHCMLAPYWFEKIARTELRAYQASARGGDMICRLRGERVELEGSCVFYLEGHVEF